uniref:Uncharacterized protein n=1 Tax=Anguilla anguilla TaxID=7936 RepID=A0A0E9VZY8_ANGAN
MLISQYMGHFQVMSLTFRKFRPWYLTVIPLSNLKMD